MISVCVDQDPAKDNGMGLFSPVKKTVRQLRRIAKDYHIPLAPSIRLPHGKRFQNEELKLLEQVIYRQERLESGEVPGHIVPVSYTHLKIDNAIGHAKPAGSLLGDQLAHPGDFKGGLFSVSYTHLDVYKRQGCGIG